MTFVLVLLASRVLHAQQSLTGTVVDDVSGAPLADAVVRARGAVVRSDTRGHFVIAAASGDTIHVRRIGYVPASAVLTNVSPLTIRLRVTTQKLESVIVTAARREQRLADAVVPTEVVSRADLDSRGATDVASAVRDLGGVQPTAGVPSGADVALQGFDSRRVLVLVDGAPVVGRVNGTLDLSRLTTANVERIEVVKGPQSTLYGSDAMGGVINIITERPENRRAWDAGVLSGSHGRRELTLGARHASENSGFTASLDGGARTVDLVPGRVDDQDTFARRWELTPAATWHLSPSWSLDATGALLAERQRYKLGQLYQHGDNTSRDARVVAGRQMQNGDRVSLTLFGSRFDHLSRRSTTPEPVSGSGDRDRQTLLQAQLATAITIRSLDVDAGVDARRDGILADRVQPRRRSLDGVEPYLQLTLPVRAVTVVSGVRASWSEQWGSAATPKLAMLWRPVQSLAVRTSIGGGYRVPDFKELYLDFVNAPAGYAVRGNPNLQPEHSTSASAAIDWSPNTLSASMSAFHTRWTDFIEAIETEIPGEYTYDNVSHGRTDGLDFTAGVDRRRWRASGSWSLLSARGPDGPLLGRARASGRAMLAATPRLGTSIAASLGYIGRTPVARDSSGVVTRWREAQPRLDVRATTRFRRFLDVQASIENVLDRRAGADWPGFSGRLWTIGLRMPR